jgi:phage baseplate assembly protein W
MSSSTPSVFGRSLVLSDGDLLLTAGDFQIIAGRDNFFQGMRNMINTPAGSDIFNVRYGFDLLSCLSAPQSPSVIKQLIKLNIVKSLSTDNRIRQIEDIAFDDEPRFYELNPESDPDANQKIRETTRRWQAVVLVQTVQEGGVTITLGGLG